MNTSTSNPVKPVSYPSQPPKTFYRVLKKILTLWALKQTKFNMFIDNFRLNYSFSRKLSVVLSLFFIVACSAFVNLHMNTFALCAGFIALGFMSHVGFYFLRRNADVNNAIKSISEEIEDSMLLKELQKLKLDQVVIDLLIKRSYLEKEIPLAEWDQNNRVVKYIEELDYFDDSEVSLKEFKKRERNKIELVVFKNRLSVKKIYEKKSCMTNELLALQNLINLSFVPKVIHANSGSKTLYMTFLPGKNLGSLLSKKGVTVTMQHNDACRNTSSNISHKTLMSILSIDQIDNLKAKLLKVHQLGVALRDIKYGNIIVNGDDLAICDFDAALVAKVNDIELFKARNIDNKRYNELFSTNLPTDNTLSQFKGDISPESYAPIYIGKGIGYGEVGSIEFGTGKWHLIKEHLPDLQGKKIVDLGSNNGNLPLEMLRLGAKHVMGFELNPSVFQLAKRNHDFYEFVDNKRYSFELNNEYMHGVLDKDLTGYDVATSFCSLYYENNQNMAAITLHLSKSVKIFVVQANENTDEHNGEMLDKSSVKFLQNILSKNGFSRQQVVRFPLYDRPMIIAKSDNF